MPLLIRHFVQSLSPPHSLYIIVKGDVLDTG